MDSFLNIFPHKLLQTFYLFSADVKKLCLLCSQKPTDKQSQALLCKKGFSLINRGLILWDVSIAGLVLWDISLNIHSYRHQALFKENQN